MDERKRASIRLLVVDDEAEVRDAYRQIFLETDVRRELAGFHELRSKLFNAPASTSEGSRASPAATFEPVFCDQAEAAVTAVQDALAKDQPFAVVFLDMRMPPGRDGVWAAARIREIDPAIEIVICTAYSDTDPGEIGGIVPPEDKLSYLQKPFHPHEVRQMAIALGSKWRAERRIVRLAYFDTLTGLPNREQSRNRLVGTIDAARKQDRQLAVLYLDLDNFKRVNDTLGHAVGDELLCVVANRLRVSLRGAAGCDDGRTGTGPGDIARLGGDEFLVMLPHLKRREDAGTIAERLITVLREPMQFANNSLVITPSIGIAVYPHDGSDVDTLLRNADLAMYFAKRKCAGTFAFYDATMNAAALHRFTLEERLRGAIERKEFFLEYQPQFDVRTGGIAGVEALLRWRDADLGLVPPSEFVPIAEECGLIVPIGIWALRRACQQAKAWQNEALPVGRIAVNVTGSQFATPEYVAEVSKALRESGLDPAVLELEIAESIIMTDEARAKATIQQLKQLGVSLAIDDFGSGYASLRRLPHFEVDRLKIGPTFVRGIREDGDDGAIATAIIAMSRSLHINVTAEGVESLPQLLFLQEQNCHEAQGRLLSEALSVEQVRELLTRVAADHGTRTERFKAIIR